jgi:hypothetical protein
MISRQTALIWLGIAGGTLFSFLMEVEGWQRAIPVGIGVLIASAFNKA